MRSLVPLIVLVLAVSAGLISCSTSTSGQAVPENAADETTTTRDSTGPNPRPTSSRSQTGDEPLAGTDPCTLLSESAKTQLGISGTGEQRKIVDARTCQWRVRGSRDTTFFSVGILDNSGISKIPSTVDVGRLPNIGAHQAVRTKDALGTKDCAVILGVGESSRVENSVIAGTDVEKACELAMQLAKLVEPKLP